MLALLFHRRVSGTSDALPGATLIGLLLRAGVPRSEALQLLGPSASLRQENWMLAEITRNGLDPLDGFFLPTTSALALFWPQQKAADEEGDEASAESGEDQVNEKAAPAIALNLTPYASEQE